MMNQQTRSFLQALWQGGKYAHLWTPDGPEETDEDGNTYQARVSLWFGVDNIPDIPSVWRDVELYFSVNSSAQKRGERQKMHTDDVTTVNCLFAEFDAKDFAGGLVGALTHISQLQFQASVIVSSGGGYHCYWLLDAPFVVHTTTDRERVQSVQRAWVYDVAGDASVHDLARVLRVPGTLNHKYSPARSVEFVSLNLDRRYSFDGLERVVWERIEELKATESVSAPRGASLGLDDHQLIQKAMSAVTNGAQFTRLWNGQHDGDHSAADQALVNLLAFWTGKDVARMDRLFRQSGLYREKWERDDYRNSTLQSAVRGVRNVYDPSKANDTSDAVRAAQAAVGMSTAHTNGTGPKTTASPPLQSVFLDESADHEGNARCVYQLYGDIFRFCGAVGWLWHNGRFWEAENAESILDRCIVDVLIKRRMAAVAAQKENVVRKTEASANNVAGTKTLFRSMVVDSISNFDANPETLNCNNGVIDLRTGQLCPHEPGQLYTYCVPVDYDPHADYVPWVEWLATVLASSDMIDYVQMALGYSLTGYTREECLFYAYGKTRSGKGTFAETMLTLLPKPLGVQADFSTFTAKREGDTQNFDLAPLKPARFIVASESNKYDTLNEAKIKTVTGGDWIRCAYKHRDHFEYRPQFKIWLMSNYPVSGDVDDDAFWGRVRVIEFPNSFFGREDKTLKQKMKSPENLSGVLAWAVRGAVEWFGLARGLPVPDEVSNATNEHRSNLDHVQQWLDECCNADPKGTGWTSNSALQASYSEWCQRNGISAKQNRQFGRALSNKGFDVGERQYLSNGKLTRGVKGIVIL
jgi:putative DNA primase/helicase